MIHLETMAAAMAGLVQSLLSTPKPCGIGGNVTGPSLHVKLAGHGPWTSVEQTLVTSPAPTVLTRLKWPKVEVEQAVFAAAPEEQGFFVRVTVTNRTAATREFELVSLVRNAGPGPSPLQTVPASTVTVSMDKSAMPGPLGGGWQLRHTVNVAGGASTLGLPPDIRLSRSPCGSREAGRKDRWSATGGTGLPQRFIEP
jgi:hypothetical protein